VSAIYARENGHGMAFEIGAGSFEEEADAGLDLEPGLPETSASADAEPNPPKGGGRSHLKLVK
jgi:stringent starvation protein B